MHPQFASSHSTRISRAALLLAAAMAALPAAHAAPFTTEGSIQAGLVGGGFESILFGGIEVSPPASGTVWNLGDFGIGVGSPLTRSDGLAERIKLTIAEGGTLFANGMEVGRKLPMEFISGTAAMGAHGDVVVTGAGSFFINSGNLTVGSNAYGTFVISDGAGVLNSHAAIGHEDRSDIAYPATGSMIVTGAGSTWINSGDLGIGLSGAQGAVQIDNGASVWVGGTLTLGATGSLAIENSRFRTDGYNRNAASPLSFQSSLLQLGGNRTIGTDVVVAEFFDVTEGLWGPSTTIGAGKHLAIEGDVALQGSLTVEPGSSLTVGAPDTEFAAATQGVLVNSTLTLEDADLTAEEGVHITSTGTLTGMGYLTGNVLNEGHIAPRFVGDFDGGTLGVDGDLALTSTSSISVGLYGEYDFDSVFATGTFTIGGALDIVSPDGFMPSIGQTFAILYFENLVGTFDQINSFSLGEGMVWDFSQLYVDGTIGVSALPTGVPSVVTSGAVTPFLLSNPQADWNVGSYLSVGFNGTGSLSITHGGTVTNDDGYIGYGAGDVGTVTVRGAGSTWTNLDLSVGESGKGTLTIEDGGKVISGDTFVGNYAGSEGTVRVTGAGSTWANSGNLYLGYEGNASLEITEGGTVTNGHAYAAAGLGVKTTITVDGAGSTWDNIGDLNLGLTGEAVMDISNGASVSNEKGYIGAYTGGVGVVNVSGAGTTWTNRDVLVVGDAGKGTLNITDGAQVTSAQGYIGFNNDSEGAVTVTGAGSRWTVATDLILGGVSHAYARDSVARLAINDGGQVAVGNSLTIHEGGTLSAQVSDTPSVTVGGDLVNNGTIRLFATLDLEPGAYTPIMVDGNTSGYGTFQTVGGVWNESSSQFVVSAPVATTFGTTTTVDLTENQSVTVGSGAAQVAVLMNSATTTADGGLEVDITVTQLSRNDESPAPDVSNGEYVGGTQITSTANLSNDTVISLGSALFADAFQNDEIGEGDESQPTGFGVVVTTQTFDSGGQLQSQVSVALEMESSNGVSTPNPGSSVVLAPGGSTAITFSNFGPDDARAVFTLTGEGVGPQNWARGGVPEDLTYVYTFSFYREMAAIPEPSSFATLAGVGALGGALLRRRRH